MQLPPPLAEDGRVQILAPPDKPPKDQSNRSSSGNRNTSQINETIMSMGNIDGIDKIISITHKKRALDITASSAVSRRAICRIFDNKIKDHITKLVAVFNDEAQDEVRKKILFKKLIDQLYKNILKEKNVDFYIVESLKQFSSSIKSEGTNFKEAKAMQNTLSYILASNTAFPENQKPLQAPLNKRLGWRKDTIPKAQQREQSYDVNKENDDEIIAAAENEIREYGVDCDFGDTNISDDESEGALESSEDVASSIQF